MLKGNIMTYFKFQKQPDCDSLCLTAGRALADKAKQ